MIAIIGETNMIMHDDDMLPQGSILLLDSARGRYIPQNFVETINLDMVTGVSASDLDTLLAGPDDPDNDWYWDAWASVEMNAVITEPDGGQEYTLHHDGDLWLVPRVTK